jgi:hypothetical protein
MPMPMPMRWTWSCVEPTEAAWELLGDAIDPFLEEMKRRAELELDRPAATSPGRRCWRPARACGSNRRPDTPARLRVTRAAGTVTATRQ